MWYYKKNIVGVMSVISKQKYCSLIDEYKGYRLKVEKKTRKVS